MKRAAKQEWGAEQVAIVSVWAGVCVLPATRFATRAPHSDSCGTGRTVRSRDLSEACPDRMSDRQRPPLWSVCRPSGSLDLVGCPCPPIP